MALTLEQIYTRYGQREFARAIEVKRRNKDNSYESTWKNIETLSNIKNVINSVASTSYTTPDDGYSFGIVKVGSLKLKLISKFGEFDGENNPNSIFNGFIRHKSLIRIRDGYVDKYTDYNSPVDVLSTAFEGFIDDTSTGTKVNKDNIIQELQCIDTLSFLLKANTKADMGALVQTTLSDLIYEILNRSEFTDFFTVSGANINPGYDISLLDMSEYEGQTQLYTIFENLSLGHSLYYVLGGIFYYQATKTTESTTFVVDEKKIINLSNYNCGASAVFEKFFWEDSNESYTSPTNLFNKPKTINIKACTDSTQRQNVLNYVGGVARVQRQKVKLIIPYYPNLFVSQKITTIYPEILPSDAFVWDVSNWDEAYWRDPISASPILQINWVIREAKHIGFKTNLILEEVV